MSEKFKTQLRNGADRFLLDPSNKGQTKSMAIAVEEKSVPKRTAKRLSLCPSLRLLEILRLIGLKFFHTESCRSRNSTIEREHSDELARWTLAGFGNVEIVLHDPLTGRRLVELARVATQCSRCHEEGGAVREE